MKQKMTAKEHKEFALNLTDIIYGWILWKQLEQRLKPPKTGYEYRIVLRKIKKKKVE